MPSISIRSALLLAGLVAAPAGAQSLGPIEFGPDAARGGDLVASGRSAYPDGVRLLVQVDRGSERLASAWVRVAEGRYELAVPAGGSAPNGPYTVRTTFHPGFQSAALQEAMRDVAPEARETRFDLADPAAATLSGPEALHLLACVGRMQRTQEAFLSAWSDPARERDPARVDLLEAWLAELEAAAGELARYRAEHPVLHHPEAHRRVRGSISNARDLAGCLGEALGPGPAVRPLGEPRPGAEFLERSIAGDRAEAIAALAGGSRRGAGLVLLADLDRLEGWRAEWREAADPDDPVAAWRIWDARLVRHGAASVALATALAPIEGAASALADHRLASRRWAASLLAERLDVRRQPIPEEAAALRSAAESASGIDQALARDVDRWSGDCDRADLRSLLEALAGR